MSIQVPGAERDSYLLFGNKHRAGVLRAITRFALEPPETFTYAAVAEVADEFGPVPPSTIHREVHLLETFGMVRREGDYDGRAIVFTRVPSPFWQIAEATAAAFNDRYPAETAQQ